MMEQKDEGIRDFTEKFFKNLKCTLAWQGPILRVSNVPKDFEDFSGKSQPYLLAFSSSDETNDTELMAKGSYLLKVMINYLETRGQTTLLKIVFDIDAKKLFEEKFKLKNSTISSISRKQSYKIIPRFTFLTTLQYLNEKEQITNSICIDKGNVLSFNQDDFESVEGRKEDVKIEDISTDYSIAKGILKKLTEPRVGLVSSSLKSQLDQEISRLKNHYNQRVSELESSITKLKNQIIQLEEESRKNPDQSQVKLSRAKESLSALEKSDALDKIKKEEAFFINDELHKRSLSVNSRLINTTIFYYPLYTFTPFLKTADGGRFIEVSFDPVKSAWSEIKCDVCATPLQEITICSTGHIACNSCSSLCQSCKKESCKKCMEKKCIKCSRELCKKCAIKCQSCGNYACKDHIRTATDSSMICINCVKYCQVCNKPSNPSTMKNSSGKSICESCNRKKVSEKTLAAIFEK